MTSKKRLTFEPQKGFQMGFACSQADIVIGGSNAGVGKTFSLLFENVKYITKVKGFGSVIFRRTTPQIRAEGGLWDKSLELYSYIKNSFARETNTEWIFKKKKDKRFRNKIKFSHLQYENDKHNWQGSEICYIGFDELTHFTRSQFLYLMTRNRSTCGVTPFIRATCNPDPWSWVRELLVSGGYVDDDTGNVIPEMEGVIRYFVVDGDGYIWGDSYEETYKKAEHLLKDAVEKSGLSYKHFIKSFTFIAGSIYDNKALLTKNPEYLGSLINQDEQTKNQLFYSNWNVKVSDLDIYNYHKFKASFDNQSIEKGQKRLSCDIALQGSNKFIIGYFEGRSLEDISIVDKSNGKEVVNEIVRMRDKYEVLNEAIVYDADGVGGFVAGYIPGAISFHAKGAVIPIRHPETGEEIIENYEHLKAQCWYHSGEAVNDGLYNISPKVLNTMYDNKTTVAQRFYKELACAKKYGLDKEGKLRILPKDKMKTFLPNGESPDLMDMFAMNEIFEIDPIRDFSVWG